MPGQYNTVVTYIISIVCHIANTKMCVCNCIKGQISGGLNFPFRSGPVQIQLQKIKIRWRNFEQNKTGTKGIRYTTQHTKRESHHVP